MEKETWKDIAGFEGKYQVSSLGRVLSLGGRKGCRNDRFLKPKSDLDGYQMVDLGKYHRNKRIHRLVAVAFVPGHADGLHVNHIDGNVKNNADDNLEWCTSKENTRHALRLGLSSVRGSDNGNSKLTAREVVQMRMLRKEGVTLRFLARQFGVAECTVSEIVRGKLWAHLGAA